MTVVIIIVVKVLNQLILMYVSMYGEVIDVLLVVIRHQRTKISVVLNVSLCLSAVNVSANIVFVAIAKYNTCLLSHHQFILE